MKRRPIPQFEFGFTSEAFNLAGHAEKSAAPEGVKIMAEAAKVNLDALRTFDREEHEREQSAFGRAQSEARQMNIRHDRWVSSLRQMTGNPSTVPPRPIDLGMMKALANFQGGGL